MRGMALFSPTSLVFKFFSLPLRPWIEVNLWSIEIASMVDNGLLAAGGCGNGETRTFWQMGTINIMEGANFVQKLRKI